MNSEPHRLEPRRDGWVVVRRLEDELEDLFKVRQHLSPSAEDVDRAGELEQRKGSVWCEHDLPPNIHCVLCDEKRRRHEEAKATLQAKRDAEQAALRREGRKALEPMTAPAEASTAEKCYPPPEPLKLEKCPHDCYVIEGFARCAVCQNMTEYDEFGIFLESLIAVASKAATKMKSKNPHRSLEDLRQSAYQKMLLHLPLIVSADNRLGMAFRVAEGALKNISRKAYIRREVAVSQLTEVNNDGEKFGIPNDKKWFRCRTMKDGRMRLSDPALLAAVKAMRPAVFLDTVVRFSEGKSENAAADNRQLMDDITVLIQEGARLVFCVHHAPKAFASTTAITLETVLRGTGDYGGMSDVVYGARKDRRKEAATGVVEIDIVCVKGRDIGGPRPFRIAANYLDNEGVLRSYVDEKHDLVILDDQANEERHIEQIIAYMEGQKTLPSLTQIEENSGVPRNICRKLVGKFTGTHWDLIERKGKGGGTCFKPRHPSENETPENGTPLLEKVGVCEVAEFGLVN